MNPLIFFGDKIHSLQRLWFFKFIRLTNIILCFSSVETDYSQALQLDFLRTMINIHEPWSKSSSIGRFSKKASSYIINIHEPGLYLDKMCLA